MKKQSGSLYQLLVPKKCWENILQYIQNIYGEDCEITLPADEGP